MNNAKKIELLAPAKTHIYGMEAIKCGADAVYIGAPNFGARAAAGNALDEIEQLVNFAHNYWAKVYVTVNTLIDESQLPAVKQLVYDLYNIGCDAIIIQDLCFLEMDLPKIPIIASTQMQNDSFDKIQFLYNAGFSRVILPREMQINQIEHISQHCSIELESFIHGALCVGYSGRCYLSQAVCGRSGNKGVCAQPCRTKFDLIDATGKILVKDKHLLSLKDLNYSDYVRDLILAGVTSFKIEGRLKDISYLRNTVLHYNKILNRVVEGEHLQRASSGKVQNDFNTDVEKTFNRGFTSYLIHGRDGSCSFLSNNTAKSLGKYLGRVTSSGVNWLQIQTNEIIAPGDGLCFIGNSDEVEGFSVQKVLGNKIYFNVDLSIPPSAQIFRNFDSDFSKKLEKFNPNRKIPVKIKVTNNQTKLHFQITDSDGVIVNSDYEIEPTVAGINFDLGNALKNQLQKLGNTYFVCDEMLVDININYFIPISQINEIRREIISKLEAKRNEQRPLLAMPPINAECKYPSEAISFTANVTNSLAEKFYRKHGVTSIEAAPDSLPGLKGKEVMITRHCLLYEMGACKKYNGNKTGALIFKEPLFLVNQTNRFELKFDCLSCEMKLFF